MCGRMSMRARVRIMRFSAVFFAILGTLIAQRAYAATAVYLNADIWTVSVGGTTHVQLSVDSDKTIGEVRVELHYPTRLVTLENWNASGSIVDRWAGTPSAASGTITMDGVISRGFSGTNGLIAELTFRGVAPGIDWILIEPKSRVFSGGSLPISVPYVPKDMQFRVVDAAGQPSPISYTSIFRGSPEPEVSGTRMASGTAAYSRFWQSWGILGVGIFAVIVVISRIMLKRIHPHG